jgi:hypothetical protein
MYLADYIRISSALINLTIFIKDKISLYSYIKITNYRITKNEKILVMLRLQLLLLARNRQKKSAFADN